MFGVLSGPLLFVDNRAFVCEAIEQLLLAGSTVEVKRDQVHVCSPLGVVPKKNGKFRLILDLRFVNKHQGIRISVYLDDGIGADSSKASCSQDTQLVRGDLDRLGLLVNEEKSNFEPRQKGEHLGFILDLTKGEFSIPPD